MLDALQQFHEMGYIHRDVKVANFRVNRSGKVYLTDFGLAIEYIKYGVHIKEAGGQAFKGTL